MDPKSAQILDPKLKEAYDRVMGSSIPTQPAPMSAPMPTATPVHAEPPKPEHADMTKPPEQHPQTGPASNPLMQHAAPPAPHPAETAAPAASAAPHASMSFSASTSYVAPHDEKKSPISGPLLIIAGVIFLVVYTLFWMKVLGMAVPFLP